MRAGEMISEERSTQITQNFQYTKIMQRQFQGLKDKLYMGVIQVD